MVRPFHLAIPVRDLESSIKFYGGLFECEKGRSSNQWIDWNFFGHQLVTHIAPEEVHIVKTTLVDKQQSPCRHFGIVLEWDQWHKIVEKLKANDIDFLCDPHIRFEGKVGEQATFMIYDPSLNVLEFKAFKDDSYIFAA
jgi:extradiol dioxygenase family protein